MRLRHPDGTLVHLAYCTNVHPAQTLTGVVRQLDRYAVPIRDRLGTDRLGLGLWLARPAAAELAADPAAVARLRRELATRGLEVVTLNGFPYADFQAPVVKHAVYHPDWSEPARLEYTTDLARVLVGLLPADAARGSISTLPLAWREPWPADRAAAAVANLDALGRRLAELDRPVRLALEPEPGCVVQTTTGLRAILDRLDSDRIGSCLDACHLAVGFEDPQQAVRRARPVVKLQVSAALQADDPDDPATRAALARFVEPRFLHQTAARGGARYDDLDLALAPEFAADGADDGRAGPWRVHFHAPLHAEAEPPLRTTRPVLRQVMDALLGGPVALVDHAEVETYTWQVLPPDRRPADDAGLVAGIAAELDWTRQELSALGLKPE